MCFEYFHVLFLFSSSKYISSAFHFPYSKIPSAFSMHVKLQAPRLAFKDPWLYAPVSLPPVCLFLHCVQNIDVAYVLSNFPVLFFFFFFFAFLGRTRSIWREVLRLGV